MAEKKYRDKFGPTFPFELRAAGLNGQPFLWNWDGTVDIRGHMMTADIKKLEDVIAAHDPEKKPE